MLHQSRRDCSRRRGDDGAADCRNIRTFGCVAFNNVGFEGQQAATAESTEENWERVVAGNLKSVWLCMKYEIPQMLRQGGGAIVNASSMSGLIGDPEVPAYSASKHGVVGLTRTAALEYAKHGIRVNAYPRVPGHEVAGRIDAVGTGVAGWAPGQRVGVGWPSGHCGDCDACRRGACFSCQSAAQVTGITSDGGDADYLLAPTQALALLPAELSAVEAGPLLCAGMTTFNALRHSGARPGDVVAILGLGHLGVQCAAQMGFKTVAIARGEEKEPLARTLGAQHYILERTGAAYERMMSGQARFRVVLTTGQ